LQTQRLLAREFLFALRRMRRSAVSSLVCILGLGLASGSVAAAFSIFDRVFLRPPPFPESERLVMLRGAAAGFQMIGDLPATLAPWIRTCPAVVSAGFFSSGTVNFAFGGRAQRLGAAQVSGDFFSTLGVAPLRGRTLGPSDVRARREAVAVVSHRLWRQLGRTDAAFTEPVSIGGYPFSIVGVMPDGFEFPRNTDLWVPIGGLRGDHLLTGALLFEFVGRLAPGHSLDAARAQIVARRTSAAAPGTPPAAVIPIRSYLFEEVRPVALWLQMASLMVLGIAAFNVVTLQAAEDDRDRIQTAVRLALGAPPWALRAQRLARYAWVAILGSLAGILCGNALVRVLVRAAPEEAWLDLGTGSSMPPRSAVAVVLACGVSTLLAALLVRSPGLRSPIGDLRNGVLSIPRAQATWISRWMLVFEVTLATGLLIGMGFLASAFHRMLAVASGLHPQEVVTAKVSLTGPRYADDAGRSRAIEGMLAQLRAVPNVVRAGATNSLPFSLTREMGTVVREEGTRWREDDPDALVADMRVVTPDYFATLGIEFIAGRDFETGDAQRYRAVIFNRKLADKFGGPAAVVGRTLLFDDGSDGPLEVVGVVGDVRHRGLDAAAEIEAYFPLSPEFTPEAMTLTASSAGTAASLIRSVRSAVAHEDPELAVEIRTLAKIISAGQQSRSFAVSLVTFFACVAGILAGIGVFAVFRDGVLRRRREFAVRLALGSSPGRLFKQIFAEALGRATLGMGIGVLLGVALYRAIQTALPTGAGVSLSVAAAMPALMYLVIAVAVFVPARQASRTDAAELLRT
jgi:putative ABC transport system permease protein